ncbi:hypothetical protein [Pseudomonas putida]|uniref:hypothetical protein n=1 Tax=Pseudomonas putida TaxID=303 RepID=UPI00224024EB|nr:hypothetical protein [Pseudomonas putida]UZM95845.1 hypothetical protein OPZ46_10655 [Pseudomonas putida DOT-T1E]
MKISEKELIDGFGRFLIDQDLIDRGNSHFAGDNSQNADVVLSLRSGKWPGMGVEKIYIEAKSHHSEDSQNTINKIFGQLLKETGKRKFDREKECLAVLFPYERGEWEGRDKKIVRRIEGEDYYRRGFSRIEKQIFVKFGELVGAKYILSFCSTSSSLRIFEWSDFLSDDVIPMTILKKPTNSLLQSDPLTLAD